MTTVTEAAPAVGMPSGQGEEKWFAAAPDFAAEVAALRKRVEELEGKIAEMLSDKDDYWSLAKCSNCGVLLNCNGSQREHESVWKARAEQAERERDELMEAHQALGREYEMQGRKLDKLQADLDAALVLCVASDWDVEVLGAGYEPEVYKAHAHVLPLLEKRRESRG